MADPQGQGPVRGAVRGLVSRFQQLPELTQISSIVTATLAILGVSTESLAEAARSATLVTAIFALVLVCAAVLPFAGRARGRWAAAGIVGFAALFGLALAITVWGANVPSRPVLSATIDAEHDTLTVGAESTNIGSIDRLDVAVYDGVCPRGWEDGTWPVLAQDEVLFYARMGANGEGDIDLSHVIPLDPQRTASSWVCVTGRVEGPSNIGSSMELQVPPPAADDEETEEEAGSEEAPDAAQETEMPSDPSDSTESQSPN